MKKVVIILDIITVGLLVFDWIYLSKYFDLLPKTIPDHINIFGDADGFGDKGFLWEMLVFITFTFGLFTVPNIIYYLKETIKVDAPEKLQRFLFPITFMKFSIIVTCSIALIGTIKMARAEIISIGIWFPLLSMTLIVMFNIFFIVSIIRVIRGRKG